MKFFFLPLLFILNLAYSQAPNVSYSTPNVFEVNQPIADLIPTNSGGAVIASTLVSTFAGSGNVGANDGNGTAATFNLPTVVTIDNFENVFVIDRNNNIIRKITPAGDVTTFAGSGISGSDDGIGTAASFNYPSAGVFDSQNNLFVSDQSNHIIRKITPDGTVTTFAGTGNIGSDDGIGTAASFYFPDGMAIDSNDNLYVADFGNNKVRKIMPDGTVFTFAGTGMQGSADGTVNTAQFNGLTGVCVDSLGNVFIADYYNNKIRKIDTMGNVSTFAGTGTAGSTDGNGSMASFYYPTIVSVDNDNNLFVTDKENNKIRKITNDGIVTTFAGDGTIGAADGDVATAQFNSPTGIAIDDMNTVFISDYGNNKIRKINTYGYTVFPALPPGLNFDPTTGIISGTPTMTSPSTDYTVTATNPDGTSTFVVNITIATLAIPDLANTTFKIYPNPVKDILHVISAESISEISISNLLGQRILYKSNLSSQEKLDVSTLSNGLYLIQAKSGDSINFVKFLKE
ncbi:MAG: T9SS type A sorting domain-containing protein [Bacteroidota bacterium]